MIVSPMLAQSAPAWQSFLAVGALATAIGGFVALQVWSQRRRRRGEEASTFDDKGAEVITAYRSPV